jgi:alpha-L-fucosidase 2
MLLFTVCFLFSGYAAGGELQNDMLLWYNTKPGDLRADPLPVGNGLIGGLVYGKIQDERIALNESSFWSGRPHDYNDPDAGKYFKQIQDLVFAGKFKEAEKTADEHFYGKPIAQQAYQPLGDLRLFFYGIDDKEAGEYYRDLDMETGVTSVSFREGGIKYTREVFVSYPDRVMVVRISADKPEAISLDVSLDSHFTENITAEPGRLVLDGCWEGPLPKYWLIGATEGKGLKFQTALQAKTDGGQSSVKKDKLVIRKANSVTLILTAATSYVNYKDINGDPAGICKKTLDNAAGKDYAALKKRHIEDFSNLMGKVHLNVGDKAKSDKPVNERILAVSNGEADTELEALCFQFGRYMLASSSRPGGQPANLQAIWNEKITPPWGSKYTININTQMNYWPAEVCNLSECHLPLVSMVKDISENGVKTAQVYYGGKGWVTHHNLDLWRGTAPVDAARFGMWPVGGAWLCRHLWEHYAFTGDKEFLKEAYPVMKGSAEFLVNLLVQHPRYGYLVTPFSMSPEHGYYFDDSNVLAYLSPAPTMDVAIMRDLFPYCIEAAKILGLDAGFCKQLETALTKLPPYKVNHLGYVQEWIEDWKSQRGGHDVSPYYPFYPGNSILLHRESDVDLVNAYRYWLESRSLRGGGFPNSWNLCMWARLERGDKTGAIIRSTAANMAGNILKQGTGSQADAPFGFTAGVAEALLQSHAGELSLLPALPVNWEGKGEVTGLRARGGYEVSMKWANGKLVSAEISRPEGGVCNVRYNGKVVRLTIPKGKPAIIND